MRYVSVIGGAEADGQSEKLAYETGAKIAESGCVLVSGGLTGVMDAASRGASEAGGTVLALIPGTDRSEATEHADYVVCTGVGQARNLAVVATGDVAIAIGGGWGTLSEIGHARRVGREVVLLATWEVNHPSFETDGVHRAKSAAEAVDIALKIAN